MKTFLIRRKTKTPLIVLLGLVIAACSSDNIFDSDACEEPHYNMCGYEKTDILLSDTTIYEPDYNEMTSESYTPICSSYDWMTPISRASSNSYREYGYDEEEPESDWRKYSLNNSWLQYGIGVLVVACSIILYS